MRIPIGAMGLGGVLLTDRLIEGPLFDVAPFAFATLAVVSAVIAGVGVVACLAPAWSASRVHPVGALRGR